MENQAEKKELSGEQLETVAGGNDVPELDTEVEGLSPCRSYGHTYEVIGSLMTPGGTEYAIIRCSKANVPGAAKSPAEKWNAAASSPT